MRYAQVKKIRPHDGHHIITAHEALETLGNTPTFFEVKDFYLSKGVLELLTKNRHRDIWVSSNNHKVILELSKKLPDVKLFASTIWHPLETTRLVRKRKLHGIALHYYWFNVAIYLYCKRHGVKLVLYTINRRLVMKHFAKFYPDIILCTDYPDRAAEFIRPSDRDIHVS